MNIVRELRKKKGIQQKELAIAIGVSCPTVSAWETNKKDPTGDRLKKLANYFEVDELVVLGKNVIDLNSNPNLFIPTDPKVSGISETEQIVQYVLDKLGAVPADSDVPKTSEARLLAKGADKLPKEQREQLLAMARLMFEKAFNEKGTESDDT